MITLELQPELEAALIAEAQADGEEVSSFVEHVLRSHVSQHADLPHTEAEQARVSAAVNRVREMRRGNILEPDTIPESDR